MPWRAKTLTKYVVGGSDDASVESDNVLQRVGDGLDVEGPGNSIGGEASDEGLLGPVDAMWQSNSDLEDSKFLQFQGSHSDRTQGALDLGASQVPRGPTLPQAKFEQHLSHAFLSTRGSLKVFMPWEKGVFKSIFESLGQLGMICLSSQNNGSITALNLLWNRWKIWQRPTTVGRNWWGPFSSMLSLQGRISRFFSKGRTCWSQLLRSGFAS